MSEDGVVNHIRLRVAKSVMGSGHSSLVAVGGLAAVERF